MKNLAISILNVDNIPQFLDKLGIVEKKLKQSKVENLFETTIHFDVMDNKFVPNTGVDIEKMKEVKRYGYYMDVHLMVEKNMDVQI